MWHAALTLNLTIVNEAGVWQCSDHRLTSAVNGEIVDDFSEKHLAIRCRDGAALIAYAGLGQVGGVDVSQWLREILRGHSRTVDENLLAIRAAASAHLSPVGMPHMFTAGAFLGGRGWIVQIRNFARWPLTGRAQILRSFETHARPLAAGEGVFTMFGEMGSVSERDKRRLFRICGKRPRSPDEFSALLAQTNRRAAQVRSRSTISPHCTTTYMPAAGEPVTSVFHDFGYSPPRFRGTPLLLFGIDMTGIEDALMNFSHPDFDSEDAGRKLSDALERPTQDATQPFNRLSRRS